ncbi:MAG TPA: hypothetical protein VNB22_17195 [Pyrinomonadaceae bacterium]|jgi:hypothetical protein|nr:hypothetical protein [Pyrinomonadaceae bacterium]
MKNKLPNNRRPKSTLWVFTVFGVFVLVVLILLYILWQFVIKGSPTLFDKI